MRGLVAAGRRQPGCDGCACSRRLLALIMAVVKCHGRRCDRTSGPSMCRHPVAATQRRLPPTPGGHPWPGATAQARARRSRETSIRPSSARRRRRRLGRHPPRLRPHGRLLPRREAACLVDPRPRCADSGGGRLRPASGVLLEHQQELETSGGYTTERLLSLAEQVPGLRGEAFDAAVSGMKHGDFVTASQKAYEGLTGGTTGPGTPTVANNRTMLGARSTTPSSTRAGPSTCWPCWRGRPRR